VTPQSEEATAKVQRTINETAVKILALAIKVSPFVLEVCQKGQSF
jgi:hypothetical protein